MHKFMYISYSFIPSKTANSINVMKMCSALAKRGVSVKLVVPKTDAILEREELNKYYGIDSFFDIVYVGTSSIKKLQRPLFILKVMIYLIFSNRAIVYSRDFYIAIFSSFFTRAFYEVHSPLRAKIKSIMLFLSLKFGTLKIISITKSLKEYIQQYENVKNDLIYVLPDAADELNKPDYYPNYNIKGKVKLGYVGHLYKGKGMEVIELLSRVLSDEYEIHIIGGMDSDINYWSKKISNKNVVFHGFIPQSDLFQYVDSIDICLLPNQKVILPFGAKSDMLNISEFTSPLKMFEYMSYGKPIIASNLTVLKEVLNDNNSILVAPDNVSEWVSAIEFLKEFERRRFIGLNAYLDFSNNYSWLSRADKLLEIIS